MNTKTFLKLGALLVLLFMATASVLAQSTGFATVYVDVTNGSDSYTGGNPTNTPAGTGPKATINGGLAALADAGKLIIVAGDYNGADGAGANVDINATSFTTGLTIELRQLNGTLVVNMTAGNFIFNVPNGTLTITTTSGTESLNLNASSNTLTLGNTTNSSTIAMATAAFFKMSGTASIIMNNSSAFSSKAPTIGNSTSTVNLTYNGVGSITAGQEAAYSTFGNGTITVNKTSGSVTFPANLLLPGSNAVAINVLGGDAVFNGTVTLGKTAATAARAGISAASTSNVTFNKAVTLVSASGTSFGQIIAANSSNITFNDAVQWNAASNLTGGGTGGSTSSSMVYNNSTGTIRFASTFTLSNATTTSSNSSTTPTTFTNNVKIYNATSGAITIVGPITNTTKTDANGNTLAYSVDVINHGSGTTTFSSAVVNNLTNDVAAGSIVLNGNTTVAGVLTNNASGATISIGSYTLTLKATAGTSASSAVANATVNGSINASGGVVTIAGGFMTFDGGTFPGITQSTGTVTFQTNPVTTGTYTLTAGTLNANIGTTVSGSMSITGTLNVTDVSGVGTASLSPVVSVSGTTTLSGSGVLNVLDGKWFKTAGFTQTGGTVSTGGYKVAGLNITGGNSGYTSTPTVTFSSGNASATALFASASMAAPSITNPGSGYTDVPTITVNNGNATVTAALTPTSVASIAVTAAGSGYTSPPTVGFTGGGGGSGAAAVANVDLVPGSSTLGQVTSITVTAVGSGYTSAPSVTFTGGAGSGATARASLVATTVASVTLTGTNNNFTATPSVSISNKTGQSGSGLAITSLLSPAALSGFTLNMGSGYTSTAPTVTVTGGGATTPAVVAVSSMAATTGKVEIDGDMARTSGTFSALNGSTVLFQGNSAQSVNGGQLFQADNITFTNTSGVITLSASVRALTTVTISAGTNVALGTFNIILSQAGGVIDNSGAYTATGGGGVVMGGSNTVAGGGLGNSTIEASPTGVFSNIIVDPGNTGGPYVVTVSAAKGSSIRFNGVLTLRSGSLDIASGADFGPTGTAAKIIRDVSNGGVAVGSTGITTLGGGGGTFNSTSPTAYDLQYDGTLANDAAAGKELTASTTNVRSLTLNVTGDLTVPPDGVIEKYITIGADLDFGGTLTINELSGLKISGTHTLTMSATGVTHTIKGELATAVSGSDWIKLKGANVTIAGGTLKAYPAKIGDIQFGTGAAVGTYVVTNIQSFVKVTANALSTVTIGMGSTDFTSASGLAAEQHITGALTLSGTSFSLGSDLYADAGISFTAGSLNYGAYNLTVSGAAQTYSQSTGVSHTSTGGALVMNSAAGSLTLTNAAAEAVPNLTILKSASLTTAGYVSGKLVIGDATLVLPLPTLTLSGVNLYYTGSAITVIDDGTGGSAVAGTGILSIAGTNVTMTASGDYTFSNLQYNPTNSIGTLTFATDDTTLTNTRVFTVTNILTHSAGVLALGVNDLKLTGTGATATTYAYIRTVAGGGTFASDGGYLEFGATTGAQNFTGGTGWSVPYLRINNAAGVTNQNTTTAFTVTKGLDLMNGTFTTGAASTNLLTMADGSTIIRRGSATTLGFLDQKPTFSGKVNISYVDTATVKTDLTVGVEMPTGTTVLNNLTVSNKTPKAGPFTGRIILIRAITVNGTLKLVAGVLDNSTYGVSIASGGGIEMAGGKLAEAPATSTYALAYSSGGRITSNLVGDEFPDPSTSTVTISNLTISGAGTILVLPGNRTVGGLTLNASGGGIELYGKILTVTGNLTVTKGNFTSDSATTHGVLYLSSATGTTTQSVKSGIQALAVAGGPQVITVPAVGLTLPYNVDLKLEDAAGFTLTGGNLYMSWSPTGRTAAGNTVYFVSGVLSTGANSVVLAQTTLGQGYDRSGVIGLNVSHVNGKIRHSIPGGAGGSSYVNGRFEFPVGTLTLYRPLAITFSSTYPAINPTNVDVSQVDTSAGGRVGMPLDGGNGVRIGNYPKYFWLVATTPSSFSATQQFDVELQGTNLGYPFSSAADLRVIRRQDGNADVNPWQLQGTGTSYQANFINVGNAGDTTVFVRSSSSSGGLVNSGGRFTIGIPTRVPIFTTAPLTGTVDENATLTQQFTGDAQDVGETIAYSLVSPPTGAAIGASSGVLTWKPTYDQAGKYNIVVSITDGQFTATTTDTVTVVNVNRPPVFSPRTSTATVKDTDTLKVTLAATDADNNTITYSFLSVSPATTNAPAVSGSLLTWKPTFADAGKTYAILVLASDGATTGHGPTPGTDTLTVNVTVNRSRARGDVDGNGSVQAADASIVLRHVAGIQLITDPAALFAADATNDGTISAFDAAKILQAAAGLIVLPASADAQASLGKAEAVAGSLAWASPEATSDPSVVKVGLKLSNAVNVYATQLTSRADFNSLSVEGVNVKLPEGWLIEWNVVGNELRIAMAGTTPLSSGDIGSITVRLKNKESRLNFSTDALLNESFQSLGAVEIAAVPTVFALEQNYPNPFNPSTTIKYQIPNDANVNLVIWNLQGQMIRTLIAKEQKAGYYNVVWDGRNEAGQTVSSGFYLYRVQAGSFVAIHKMMLIK